MLNKLKELVVVAEAMIAQESREVVSMNVEVNEEYGLFGVVKVGVWLDGGVFSYSEPFEWKNGTWISMLPVEFGVPDGLPY